MITKPKAVCLLSGGLDSAVAASVAKNGGFDLLCLSIFYGQKHQKELECARKIAEHFGATHKIMTMMHPGGSALTDQQTEVPQDRADGQEIPNTYVPGRNIIFSALAASLAEVIGSDVVYVGFNSVDYSGYPDCRPEFVEAMNKTLSLGLKAGVQGQLAPRIVAPLIDLSKADIIKLGLRNGVPFQHTWSCYVGGEKPCGHCDSCKIRAAGFAEAGVKDAALE